MTETNYALQRVRLERQLERTVRKYNQVQAWLDDNEALAVHAPERYKTAYRRQEELAETVDFLKTRLDFLAEEFPEEQITEDVLEREYTADLVETMRKVA